MLRRLLVDLGTRPEPVLRFGKYTHQSRLAIPGALRVVA
jgi:hypothetical protein